MHRTELFDLAINRASSYLDKLSVDPAAASAQSLHGHLELWYLKTRFAYRVALQDVIAILQKRPGKAYFWQGGVGGNWLEGKAPRP